MQRMVMGFVFLLLQASSACGSESTPVAICSSDEPGERLVFSGRILDYQGKPLSKASVVAYHADSQGLYNPRNSATRDMAFWFEGDPLITEKSREEAARAQGTVIVKAVLGDGGAWVFRHDIRLEGN